jgi:HEPN domain-containing protein
VSKKNKSPEEIQDDNERTNSMGLFNMAEAYRLSALALEKAKVKIGHADSPIRWLYFHALELYLKALLRQKYPIATIERFRHKFERLVAEAENLGLDVMDEDRKIFSVMINTDMVIEARYIRTGSKTLPTLEGLRRTSISLRESVGGLLRQAGIAVRL